jgi:hypothetical protein
MARTRSSRGASEPVVPATTFHIFPKLPTELRDYTWELAVPGPRLIEVYPRPNRPLFIDETPRYKWRATKCACKHHCQQPLVISHVCRESRKVFAVHRLYQKCFGTLVDWDRDVIYVGSRVGSLHNNEFLKTLSLAGGTYIRGSVVVALWHLRVGQLLTSRL